MDPFSTSVWTRESRPARSSGLSRPQIVRAAMELLDTEGLEGLSMRRLGAKLGSGATSIYWHVAHKDELLELVLDEFFGEVPLPAPDMAGWRNAAAVFAYGLRAAFFAHPWSVKLIGSRPTLGPNAMRLAARLLNTFTVAGFKGGALDYATSALMAYVLGSATPEITWRSTVISSGVSEKKLLATGKAMVERAAQDYPELAARYAEHSTANIETIRALNFDFGLTCFLDGLEAQLRRSGTSLPDQPDQPAAGSTANRRST